VVDKLMRALGYSDLNIKAVLQDGNNLPSNPTDCTIHIQDSHDMKVHITFIQ